VLCASESYPSTRLETLTVLKQNAYLGYPVPQVGQFTAWDITVKEDTLIQFLSIKSHFL
jgi:hypothetical protein